MSVGEAGWRLGISRDDITRLRLVDRLERSARG
jgi:hypothetical protein